MEASGYINYNFGSNKDEKNFLLFFSSVFGHQNPRSGLDLDPDPDSLKMLDPDPYPDPMFPGPQH